MFKKIEGDTVLLKQNGVFKVCDLYEWSGGLYAAFGGGYIRLRKDGTTTKQGVQFDHMETERLLFADQFGRLAVEAKAGYKPLTLTHGETLQIEYAKPEGEQS